MTVARAKNGLSAAVTHSARVTRGATLSLNFGLLPSRKVAWMTVSVLGILIERLSIFSGSGMVNSFWTLSLMPEKNAAMLQNCSRFQSLNGWLWHWAHSSLMPRNSREVLAARFSALASLARKKASGVGLPRKLSSMTRCWLPAGSGMVSRSRTTRS